MAQPRGLRLRTAREQGVVQQGLGAASRHTGAELTQNRGIEAGVGQVEAEQVLPVDASSPRIGRMGADRFSENCNRVIRASRQGQAACCPT